MLTMVLAAALSVSPVDWLHPGSPLAEGEASWELAGAVYHMLDHLEEIGAEDVLLCEAQRIEAPLGGWLMSGLFRWEHDDAGYSTFLVGIEESRPDEPFVLLARGVDETGLVRWYPPPGPGYVAPEGEAVPEEMLDYEFLLDREAFESLEESYPRPARD